MASSEGFLTKNGSHRVLESSLDVTLLHHGRRWIFFVFSSCYEFQCFLPESYSADHRECLRALRETSDPEILCGPQATFFLTKLLEYPQLSALYSNKKFSKRVCSVVAR